MSEFPAIRIEGGLLGPDVLDQLLAADLPGQKPADFGLSGRRSLIDEIAAVFADARTQWEVFQHRLERLPENDPATSVTRDAWMIPLLSLLGYELRYNPRAYEVDGTSFAISHRAGENDDAPPVHIVGARQELGRVAATGRPRLAPHSLVQEFLNRTEQLWGLVTNGFTLRLLRDSTYIRRQAYVEFDLAEIFEEQRFNDFVLLYRLLHRSRLPGSVADARNCLLERYYQHSLEQGGRVRERLRDGVEQCLTRLANGFLSHPANSELRQRILNGEWRIANSEWHIDRGDQASPFAIRRSPFAQDLYRQLLRLVYRFLFLLVSEDRGLISADPLYREHYGVGRLRRLLDLRSAYTDHDDLWRSLRVLWRVLADDRLAPMLGAAPLNGELFEPLDLDACSIANRDLLEAFWHLAYYRDTPNNPPRRVNYAALDVEELGSVYESLLDYHPQIDTSGTVPRFELAPGSERKATGSYYTPPELVAELVRSALEPVIEERLAWAKRMANSEWRMANSEWRHLPQSLKEKFHDQLQRLSRSRSLATGDRDREASISADAGIPSVRTLWDNQSNPPGGNFNPGQHRGGLGAPLSGRVSPVPPPGEREPHGTGDASDACRRSGAVRDGICSTDPSGAGHAGQTTCQSRAQSPAEEDLSALWSIAPFAIRYSLFAEHAILSLRVLDPACGSGHFLLAAARRLGKELARIRTGEEEPAPEHVRESIRDVVGHCIYGVDKNPLAVELCKVALWLEAHSAGKPLTFLDHRIKCGDSLVGVVDLEVLKAGIPDEAYTPLSGDDKARAASLKRQNRQERPGQRILLRTADLASEVQALAAEATAVGDIPDDSPAAIRRKKERYLELQGKAHRDRVACHLWTAAFFQYFQASRERRNERASSKGQTETASSEWRVASGKGQTEIASSEWRVASGKGQTETASSEWRVASGKGQTETASSEWRVASGKDKSLLATHDSPLAGSSLAITTDTLFSYLEGKAHPQVVAEAEALALQHRFFHWPLEFPEVFGASRNEPPPFAVHHSPFATHGGFDVVLGNPPWERIKLQEQEFFASRDRRIAEAPNAAARKRLIGALPKENPELWQAYREALHAAESQSRFLRASGFYPLTGRGDINTYSVFTERMRALLKPGGRMGVIVPTGIATDDTNKHFFAQVAEHGELASLYDFENRKKLFPAVDSRMKFSLLTLRKNDHHSLLATRHSPLAARYSPLAASSPLAEFAFFLHEAADLSDPERRFTLAPEDFRLLNPNTKTAPIFRSRRDAELTKHIYRRVPVLIEEAKGEAGNPWGVEFLAMLHMANDSHLFRTREELEDGGFRIEGNVFTKKASSEQRVASGAEDSPLAARHSPLATRFLPLYEAKMVHQFDHRFATYRGERMANSERQMDGGRVASSEWRVEIENVGDGEKADPEFRVLPRYWVPEAEVEARLATKGWDRGWLLGWRDICRSTDERTVIAAVIPRVGVGNNYPLIITKSAVSFYLGAVLSCFALDFVARQKVGGTHLNFFIFEQLPVLPPSVFDQPLPFPSETASSEWRVASGKDKSLLATRDSPLASPTPLAISNFIRPRVLELTYTAWDLKPFAQDLGYDGPPFRYDPERRFCLRCELDALFFLLYLGTPEEWEKEASPELKALFPTPRDAVAYILDQFPIVRRKDEERFGEYRTKRAILEIYDAMTEARRSGRPWRSKLNAEAGYEP